MRRLFIQISFPGSALQLDSTVEPVDLVRIYPTYNDKPAWAVQPSDIETTFKRIANGRDCISIEEAAQLYGEFGMSQINSRNLRMLTLGYSVSLSNETVSKSCLKKATQLPSQTQLLKRIIVLFIFCRRQTSSHDVSGFTEDGCGDRLPWRSLCPARHTKTMGRTRGRESILEGQCTTCDYCAYFRSPSDATSYQC